VIAILTKASRPVRNLLGIDRAVGFTVMARGWTIVSGALTILLIARFLSPTEQGYYYTFSSLVALQSVFELGFSVVILQLAAHECSKLKIEPSGEIIGDKATHSRLASVLQKVVRWYSAAALLMATTLVIAGFEFFALHAQPTHPVAWRLPWTCVVVAAIFTFQMDPVFSFLEGCGFVPQVAHMRFAQAVAGTTFAWTTLVVHRGLFAPAAIIFGQAGAGFVFLISKKRLLLPLLRYNPGTEVVGWRAEIWPFQWRLAVSILFSYLIYPLFSPVLFAYRGAAEAGRMGMSLNIANSLGAFAQAWIYTKASPFGKMVARREFAVLDRLFFRTLMQSGAALVVGDAMVLIALNVAGLYFPRLGSRMLPVPLFALLMFSVFLNHIVLAYGVYLRAHKREPLLLLVTIMATLTACSTLAGGRLWGAAGMTIGYFFCGGLFYIAGGTYIFITRRRMWHHSSGECSAGCENRL